MLEEINCILFAHSDTAAENDNQKRLPKTVMEQQEEDVDELFTFSYHRVYVGKKISP